MRRFFWLYGSSVLSLVVANLFCCALTYSQNVHLDGTTTFAAALAALPSGGTLRISAGTYTISATANLVSNLDIECSANNTILQASSTLNAPLFTINGANHLTIRGCVLDGNRTNNTNSNDIIQLTNASYVVIDQNHIRNSFGNGVSLVSGNSNIEIAGNEIDHIGSPLPAVGATAIVGGNGAAASVHIKIIGNRIHDNNLGIFIFPGATGTTTFDWDISHNKIWSNANDAMALFSASSSGFGVLTELRFIDNDSECNGYPANGTGFDPFCSAVFGFGFLQTGSVSSSSGSGLDLNTPNMEEIVAIGNNLSHNFIDGLDSTPQTHSTVKTSNGALGACSANCVQATSGDAFNTTAWKTGQGLVINGAHYLVASVQSTTVLTLTSAPGTQTGVSFTGPGYTRNTIANNIACDNGHGAPAASSAGFFTISIGDRFSGNVACRNNVQGFADVASGLISHSNEYAFNNNLSGAFNGNFSCQACLSPQYGGISGDGNTYVLTLDSQVNNAYVNSTSSLPAQIQNLGTNDGIETNGTNRDGPFIFDTGGSYFINGSPGAGAYGSVFPQAGTPSSPVTLTFTVASGTASLNTAAITSLNCASVVTVGASGVASTDSISWNFNAAPSGAYLKGLFVLPYVTSGNVNFYVCNPTAGSLTPPAATLNWRVTR